MLYETYLITLDKHLEYCFNVYANNVQFAIVQIFDLCYYNCLFITF